MEHSGFMALEDKELTIYWIWGLSSVLLVLYFSLTCNQTNSVNIPHYYLRPSYVSKWVVCLNCTPVSSETLLLRGRPTLTPHSFKSFLHVRSTDTWVGLLADQVPSRMLGLAPSHVKADLPAETVVLSLRCAWIKNVGNSSRADLCWLVGRVGAGFRSSSLGNWFHWMSRKESWVSTARERACRRTQRCMTTDYIYGVAVGWIATTM